MKRSILYISILLSIFLFACPGTAFAASGTESVEETYDTAADTAVFTCTRNNGDIFHSFKNADGTHILYLPADFDLTALTVTCLSDEKMVSVSQGTVNPGSGTIKGNFKGRALTVSFADGSSVSLLMQASSLPSLAITLQGSTLDDVHADKDAKHTAALTTLYDPENAANDLIVTGGEFKGRGNSSWVYYDKKGYQIKFPEEVSVLGMEKAKKWVLLAGSSDSTLLRTKLALDAAAAFPLAFTPECEFADLWVNGDYRGLYLITEKPEIAESRLNLKSGHGVLVEYDNAFYSGEDYWFADSYDQYFALKDSQGEDPESDFAAFESKVLALDRAIEAKNWAAVLRQIDPESFACALIINEYFSNRESATTSFFWYLDGSSGKLTAGPVWDFDTSMADENNPTDYYVFQNKYYKYLIDFEEFEDILQQVYEKYGGSLKNAAASQDALQIEIAASAAANFMRYDVLGTTDAKKHEFLPTWEENLTVQRDWLTERAEHFSVGSFCAKRRNMYLETRISAGNRYADLYFRYPRSVSGVIFKVHPEKLPSDEPEVYEAEQDKFGRWHAQVDILDFCVTGTYTVEACSTYAPDTPLTERTFEITYKPAMDYTRYGINYRAVFNPLYYAEHNADVAAVCGSDPRVLFRHFRLHGMTEGRRGSLLFDPEYYMETNEDLLVLYGSDDLTPYYIHYCTEGRAEGRVGAEEFAK